MADLSTELYTWVDPEKIDQTEFGDGTGNCRSACLAMMLRLPLSEVPNFNQVSDDRAISRRTQMDWLLDRGWTFWTVWSPEVVLSGGGRIINKIQHFGEVSHPTSHPWPPRRGFYIASGLSDRDSRHSVIYRDGVLWHDPHPDRTGLVVMDVVDFLRPLYPAGLQRITR